MRFQRAILVILQDLFLLISRTLLIWLITSYLLQDKLYAVGLSQNAVLWFNSYLHSRKLCVVLQESKTDLFVQQRGVPQGSTLSPLLFSISVNDLPLICSKSFILLNLTYCQSKLPFNLTSILCKTGSYLINYLSIKQHLTLRSLVQDRALKQNVIIQ